MAHDWISVRGARVHNLKNIDVDIPRHKLVVITGLSGSGKSSLAFDTIYAEGQRRYVESLSAYARQFLEQMEKPDVDLIDGLSPAISIEQKTTGSNPRSTVGTVTEIYDYLRLLFANIGVPHCPNCGKEITSQSLERIVDMVMLYPQDARINVLAPIVRGRKGEFKKELAALRARGFTKARIDGQFRSLDEDIKLDRRRNHTIDVRRRSRDRARRRRAAADRVDRRRPQPRRRHRRHQLARRRRSAVLAAAGVRRLRAQHARDDAAGVLVQLAARRVPGLPGPRRHGRFRSAPRRAGRDEVARRRRDRAVGARRPEARARSAAVAQPHSRHRSQRPVREAAAQGARAAALGRRRARGKNGFEGLLPNLRRRFEEGSWAEQEELEPYRSLRPCPDCHGERLKRESLSVKVKGRTISDYVDLPIAEALRAFDTLQLTDREALIAERILREIQERLRFLHDVGVGYLTLGRSAATLSGGEGQRIRLATQIGANLTGVLYVLDEPSIGLHQRDNRKLLATLARLRDLGNTVIVVEHDEETIRTADYVIDLGPGAGEHGGHVIFQGTPAELMDRRRSASSTGAVPDRRAVDRRCRRRAARRSRARSSIRGARENNLKNIDVRIPLGAVRDRHRRQRLRQVHARQRHPVQVARARRSTGPATSPARTTGSTASSYRQGDRDRSVAHRAHAPLEPRHLHRAVHVHPRSVRDDARRARRAGSGRAASRST